MRPTRIRDKKMELFNRAKAILFNPKEEWEVIEAENSPHAKVLPYLLILALIPAIAFFAKYWFQWHSAISKAKEAAINAANNNPYLKEHLAETFKNIKESSPFFGSLGVSGIIAAVNQILIIVGAVYLATILIHALSDQFGVSKDFNRTFSLVTFSFTPLCVAGILYIYTPLAWLIPLIGLYGVYLLFIGIKPLIKPAEAKQTGYIVMALLVTVVAYIVVTKIVPSITTEIYSSIVTSGA